MYDDQRIYCEKQLHREFQVTKDQREMDELKKGEKEKEIEERYNFFSDKICEIFSKSDDIFEKYKKSESLKKLKSSDEIRKKMKLYLADLEKNELLSLLEKIEEFKFTEEINLVIHSELINNLELFVEEYKSSKKAAAMEIIGQIKSDFENNFKTLKFHIQQFEKKMSEQIADVCIEEKHVDDIKDLIKQIMKQKLIDLINKELKYL